MLCVPRNHSNLFSPLPGSDEPVADIEGHSARVARVTWHPSGRFLGTTWWAKRRRHPLHPYDPPKEPRRSPNAPPFFCPLLPEAMTTRGVCGTWRLRRRSCTRRATAKESTTCTSTPTAPWPGRGKTGPRPPPLAVRRVGDWSHTHGSVCSRIHSLISLFWLLLSPRGLDSFGRIWDLRTGRCVMFLEGHLKEIYSINFSPNGYAMTEYAGNVTRALVDAQ